MLEKYFFELRATVSKLIYKAMHSDYLLKYYLKNLFFPALYVYIIPS